MFIIAHKNSLVFDTISTYMLIHITAFIITSHDNDNTVIYYSDKVNIQVNACNSHEHFLYLAVVFFMVPLHPAHE